MSKGMASMELPQRRITTCFDLLAMPRLQRRFWLVVQRPEPEVCVKPPGFEEDLVVTTDADWLARWVLGQTSLGDGMKARRVNVQGPREPRPRPEALRRSGCPSTAGMGRSRRRSAGRHEPPETSRLDDRPSHHPAIARGVTTVSSGGPGFGATP